MYAISSACRTQKDTNSTCLNKEGGRADSIRVRQDGDPPGIALLEHCSEGAFWVQRAAISSAHGLVCRSEGGSGQVLSRTQCRSGSRFRCNSVVFSRQRMGARLGQIRCIFRWQRYRQREINKQMGQEKDTSVGAPVFVWLSPASVPIGSVIIFGSIHHWCHWHDNSTETLGAHIELGGNLVDKEYYASCHVVHACRYVSGACHMSNGGCVGPRC